MGRAGRALVVTALAAVLGACDMGTPPPRAASHSEAPDSPQLPLYDRLRASLSVEQSGYGVTDYPGNLTEHIPKAYAMVLLAELNRARVTGTALSAQGLSAGNWLLDHAHLNSKGVVGWGVPVAWDAFGDGTVNPAHTVYTISTGIVVKALLDWSEFDQGAPTRRILSTVSLAIATFLDDAIRSPSGLLPFSLEPPDRRYDTFNPAAYLAGQIQRWSLLAPEPVIKVRAAAVADATMRALLDHHMVDPAGGWYWHYSVQERVPNDLAHAAYIVEGIRTYVAANGRLSREFDVPAALRHLATFKDPGNGVIHSWPMFRLDVRHPARLYDIGMALAVAASARPALNELETAVAASVAAYRTPDGRFAKYPLPPSGDPPAPGAARALVVREYECYLLYGLSHHMFPPALDTK